MSELKLNWDVTSGVEAREGIQVVMDKYSEVFKEGLGMLRGITAKIHIDPQATYQFYCPRPLSYAWNIGRRFIINTDYTDYKPLIHLCGEHCSIPQLASSRNPRIQRWVLILGSYTYSVQYKPGKELQHADG